MIFSSPESLTVLSDAPVVSVLAGRREHHPKLKQTKLTIACNVTADPAPDVNWARGRTVLSKYDSKVGQLSQQMRG